MSGLPFFAISAVAFGALIFGLRRRYGYLEYPTITAAVFCGWVLPQLWRLEQTYGNIHSEYISLLEFFCALCILAVMIGWRSGTKKVDHPSRFEPRMFTDLAVLRRLAIVSTVFTLGVSLLLQSIDIETTELGTPTGGATIVFMLLNLKTVSLFISAYLFLKKRDSLTTIILLVNLSIFVPLVFVFFRRRATFELFICLSLAFWYARGKTMPRVLILFIILFSSIAVFAAGELRTLNKDKIDYRWKLPSLSVLSEVDFLALTPLTKSTAAPEITNALVLVQLAERYDSHTYGAASWNRLIFQWVPGQLIGAENKRAMMIDLGVTENLFRVSLEDDRLGSTPTGMGEAFLEFGLFGIVFFYVTAYVLGRWWENSLSGSVHHQVLYATGLPAGVLMPTTYPAYFFVSVILYVIATFMLFKIKCKS